MSKNPNHEVLDERLSKLAAEKGDTAPVVAETRALVQELDQLGFKFPKRFYPGNQASVHTVLSEALTKVEPPLSATELQSQLNVLLGLPLSVQRAFFASYGAQVGELQLA